MEVTTNLPLGDWCGMPVLCVSPWWTACAGGRCPVAPLHPANRYVNTTDNDLAYWGLDYPPVTAYQVGCVVFGRGVVRGYARWTDWAQRAAELPVWLRDRSP